MKETTSRQRTRIRWKLTSLLEHLDYVDDICVLSKLWISSKRESSNINPFTAKDLLIDFTLSNARRCYSSKGNPLTVKGLNSNAC